MASLRLLNRIDIFTSANYCPSVLNTVGWVIWPVKIVPNMTYNVFGGALNSTLLMKSSLASVCLYVHRIYQIVTDRSEEN